jgi:quercetin dioxygenase-like cupin family protein
MSIEKLEELTKKLPPLAFQGTAYKACEFIEYEVKDGTSLGCNLFSVPEVLVQRLFFSKGTIFHNHLHLEREWFILYKGKIKISTIKLEKILEPSCSMYIDANTAHSGEVLEDSWLIRIKIPAPKDGM